MICNLCKKKINEKREKYVHIEDLEKKKVIKELWCHNKCYGKAMNRELTDLEKQAKGMLDMAGGIFANLPEELKPKKEFVIQ